MKGGGHSPGGASSVENGLVIDLGLMRQVSVKPEEQLVIADGGCLYGDVCKASSEYGLACGKLMGFVRERGGGPDYLNNPFFFLVGGTTSHVGIGGLSLSGGYGYLTGEYG